MPLTNAIIHALQQYGEHIEVVKNKEEADTFLFVSLTVYDRSPARFNEADFLQQSVVTAFAEMALYRVDVEEQLKNPPKEPLEEELVAPLVKPFFSSTVSADAQYFIEPNQPEGENSVRPQLYEELAREVVHQIVNRWVTPSSPNVPSQTVSVPESTL